MTLLSNSSYRAARFTNFEGILGFPVPSIIWVDAVTQITIQRAHRSVLRACNTTEELIFQQKIQRSWTTSPNLLCRERSYVKTCKCERKFGFVSSQISRSQYAKKSLRNTVSIYPGFSHSLENDFSCRRNRTRIRKLFRKTCLFVVFAVSFLPDLFHLWTVFHILLNRKVLTLSSSLA